MKLYIIRHGETDANAQGIVQGWLDTELNENGLAQAVQAANNFTKRIDAIYSSDLKRAAMTAQQFRAKYSDVPYFEDDRLRERDFGDATGTLHTEHDWEQFWLSEDTQTIPNIELTLDFTARVKSFLDELKSAPYESALIVAHEGVLNRVQAIINQDHAHYPHPNTSILEVNM